MDSPYDSFALGEYGLSPEEIASMEAAAAASSQPEVSPKEARRSSVIRLHGNQSKEVETVYIGSVGEFRQDNQARRSGK